MQRVVQRTASCPISRPASPAIFRARGACILRGVAVGLLSLAAVAGCGELKMIESPDATPTPTSDAGGIDAVSPDNADLASLELSSGHALEPAFAPEQSAYTASLSFLVQTLALRATTVHPDATVAIEGVLVGQGEVSDRLSLPDEGTRTLRIDVSAPSGATQSYTLTVERSAEVAQLAFVKASNPGSEAGGDEFGHQVAISGDTMVVGAPREDGSSRGVDGADNDDANNAGAVYVFRRNGDTWQQEAYLKASNGDANDQFGFSVAVDGDTLVVGAPGESSSAAGIGGGANEQANNTLVVAGAAYVFERSGGVWQQTSYVKSSQPSDLGIFGFTVAVDGDRIAVGEPGQGTGEVTTGRLHLYQRDSSGVWQAETTLRGSNTEQGDRFGLRVSLDGERLAVGATGEASASRDTPGNDEALGAGAVYVFGFDDENGWSEEAYVKPEVPGGPSAGEEAGQGDGFGIWLALDGDTLAVSAVREDSSATGIGGNQDNNNALNAGAVYVFERGQGAWTQAAYIKAEQTTGVDIFGEGLALRGDVLAVGVTQDDGSGFGVGSTPDDASVNTGAVYVFRRDAEGAWVQSRYLKASNAGRNDLFGLGLALSEDVLAVGARGEASSSAGIDGGYDDALEDSGAVYLFY